MLEIEEQPSADLLLSRGLMANNLSNECAETNYENGRHRNNWPVQVFYSDDGRRNKPK